MSRTLVALLALLVCLSSQVEATKVRVGSSANVPVTDQIIDVAKRAVALANQGIQDSNSQYSFVRVAEAKVQPVAGVIYTLKLVLNTPDNQVVSA